MFHCKLLISFFILSLGQGVFAASSNSSPPGSFAIMTSPGSLYTSPGSPASRNETELSNIWSDYDCSELAVSPGSSSLDFPLPGSSECESNLCTLCGFSTSPSGCYCVTYFMKNSASSASAGGGGGGGGGGAASVTKKSRFKKKKSILHKCNQPGCDYQTKRRRDLKRHKADVHDIGVNWHHCDQPGCDYRAKRKSDLKRHKKTHRAPTAAI